MYLEVLGKTTKSREATLQHEKGEDGEDGKEGPRNNLNGKVRSTLIGLEVVWITLHGQRNL